MKIFVDVGEAAERLEELVELAFRGDDIFVCRDERAVAQLTIFSNEDENPTTGTAKEGVAGTVRGNRSGNLGQAVRFCSIDEVRALAADDRTASECVLTSSHDSLYDAGGLPR